MEGDSYTKTPVPSRIGRGAQTDTTSDYDSSSGNISTSSRPSGQSTGDNFEVHLDGVFNYMLFTFLSLELYLK